MADSKKTDSGSGKESQAAGSCCDFEKMSKMMQECCGGDEGSFDLKAMMQNSCCSKPQEPEK